MAPSSLAVCALLGLVCPNAAARVRPNRGRASPVAKEVRVGTLAGHDPGSWSGACGEAGSGSLVRARCNLAVYEEAVRAAKVSGVDLLLLPEYGLTMGGFTVHTDIYPRVGDRPCDRADDPKRAQVGGLSCMAAKYQVALAASVITSHKFNSYISQIIYDPAGTVLAVYHKDRRFLPMEIWAKSGGFNPTVFELFGRKWGLAICYEGLFPQIPLFGNWKQFESLREQGAQNILWSVGNTAIGSILTGQARTIANRVNMSVFASMNKAMITGETTALVSPEGRDLPRGRSGVLDRGTLAALGYTDSPTIDVATV